MQQWITTYREHIKLCLQQAQKRESHQLRDIRHWCHNKHTLPSSTGMPTTQAPSKKHTVITQVKKVQGTLQKFFQTRIKPRTPSNTARPKSQNTTRQVPASTYTPPTYIQTFLRKRTWKPRATKCATTDTQGVT